MSIGVAASFVGCASAPPPPAPAPASLPALVQAFASEGLWFGRSEHSPFGPMPYALVPRRDGDTIVLRGDVPPGLGLPDGSYQQFTFRPDPQAGSRIDFETSLAGPLATGRLVEVERADDHVRYCLPPDAGACRAMRVDFRREGDGVRFETRRDDTPHHAVVLRPTQPR
jgi:hypothetical protein